MTANQLPYANGAGGEAVAGSTSKQPVIPAQRGASDRRVAPTKRGELKPILAPWMKDRAEFTYKMQDVGKRAAHTVGWHLWRAPMNALRVLWFAACGLFCIVGSIWVWVFDLEHRSLSQELTADEYVTYHRNSERRLSQRGKVVGVGLGIVVWTARAWRRPASSVRSDHRTTTT